MNTINRKYKTISIPVEYSDCIPKLKKAYSQEKGVRVSGGEAIGIALKSECSRLGVDSVCQDHAIQSQGT